MAYEINYYPRPYGITIYAVGDLEDLPNKGGVFSRGEGLGLLWYERLGGFSNLSAAREFCEEQGYPEPCSPCVLGW